MTLTQIDEMNFLTDQEWKDLATKVTRNVNDWQKLRSDYRQAIVDHLKNPAPVEFKEMPVDTRTTEVSKFTKKFEATVVPGVLKLQIVIEAETSDDWKVSADVAAIAFGYRVGGAAFQLSRVNSYIEIHPGMLLAKADLKFFVAGDRLCFGVTGQACFWGWGWHCTPINAPTLFCMRS